MVELVNYTKGSQVANCESCHPFMIDWWGNLLISINWALDNCEKKTTNLIHTSFELSIWFVGVSFHRNAKDITNRHRYDLQAKDKLPQSVPTPSPNEILIPKNIFNLCMGPRKPDMNIGQHVNAVSHLKSIWFVIYIECEISSGTE